MSSTGCLAIVEKLFGLANDDPRTASIQVGTAAGSERAGLV